MSALTPIDEPQVSIRAKPANVMSNAIITIDNLKFEVTEMQVKLWAQAWILTRGSEATWVHLVPMHQLQSWMRSQCRGNLH